MDSTPLQLPVQTSWDARITPVDMIEGADYALLKGNHVVLVAKTTDTSLHGVVLTNEQGLHYDGDATITKKYAQEKLQEGAWTVTRDWARAEEHLRC
jgi:hypothetical protein